MNPDASGGTDPIFGAIGDAVRIIQSRRGASGPLWPSRADRAGSALGRRHGGEIFTEYVERFARALLVDFPMNIAAGPATDRGSLWVTVYETVEQHTRYFAEYVARRNPGATGGRVKRPYDEMLSAFPPSARLVPALMLIKALRHRPEEVVLQTLELAVLHRRVATATRLPHAHPGKPNCGSTLNVAVLIAHLQVRGSPRCIVLGTRGLPARVQLADSIPRATEAMRSDLCFAARYASRKGGARLSIETCPVVVTILPVGGPMGKGRHNKTDAEFVPGRVLELARAIGVAHARDDTGPELSAQPPVLQLAARPTGGPAQIQPSVLRPERKGWPDRSERFIEAFAAAAGRPQRPVVEAESLPSEEWWYTEANLQAFQLTMPVRLLARRPLKGGSVSVWVTRRDSHAPVRRAVNAVLTSRVASHHQTAIGQIHGSPFGFWVERAFRRYAAGELMLKGGASEALRTGVTAGMTSAFLAFVLSVP